MKTDKTIAAQPTIAHNNRKCGLHLLWKHGLMFPKRFNGSSKSQSLKTKQKQNIWYERYVIDFKTTLRDSYIVWFLLQKPFNTCTLMIIPNSVVVCFNPPWLNRIIKRLCIFFFSFQVGIMSLKSMVANYRSGSELFLREWWYLWKMVCLENK